MQPRNALMPFELPQAASINALTQPLSQALDTYRQGMKEQFEGERALARERMEQDRLSLARNADVRAAETHSLDVHAKKVQQIAGLAQMADAEADPTRKAAIMQRVYAMHPEMATRLTAAGQDPNNHGAVAKFLIAEARGYRDPLEEQMKRTQIAGMGLQQRLTAAQLDQIKTQTPDWRAANAERFGLQKGTPEWSQFVISGQYAPKDDIVHAKADETIGQKVRQPDGSYKVVPVMQGMHKTPAGYRETATGLEPIPGGPADIKQNEKRQQDYASLQSVTQQLDELAASVNRVKTAPGLAKNFGMQGLVPNMPGGAAANAAALLDTLRTQGAFAALQEMRNASKTGGALGAISDKENAMLQNAIAALQRAQSYDQAQQQLGVLQQHIEASKTRLRNAYNDHWNRTDAGAERTGIPLQAPQSGPVRIQGDADYEQLPSGTQFVGPDGKVRMKP